MTAVATRNPAEQLRERCGADLLLCYQCQKCTLGCPLSGEMDLMPHQVMRLLQLGRLDGVLRSRTIWLCASCQTCTTRCPTGIDITQIMDTLKIMAQEQGIEPRMPASTIFINAGLRSIKALGRMYELGLMVERNLRLGQPLKDAGLGLKMWRAGRLRLIPERAGYPRKLRRKKRAELPANAIAYYPGCSLHASASEYDRSFRAAAAALGLKLQEPRGWVCCGGSPAHWKSRELAHDLALKNLALVESLGHQAVTVPCAMCFSRLRHAAHDVAADPSLKDNLSHQVGYDYRGQVGIENAVDTIVKRVGLEKVAENVRKPLSGLKVVCYYGCLLTRPPSVTGAEHPEYPRNMDLLMQALGAEVRDWSFKTDCCGGSLSLFDTDQCLTLIKKIIDGAREVEAEAVVTACPMCHTNLDGRQAELSRREGQRYQVPIFYFTQLLALALGLGEKRAAVHGHLVDPKPLLAEKGIMP